jgi:hypothetical protein
MTNRELNRDYKRLARRVVAWRNTDGYWENNREAEIKKELSRLYYADPEMFRLNRTSILIFLALNQSFRVVPLHIIVRYSLTQLPIT